MKITYAHGEPASSFSFGFPKVPGACLKTIWLKGQAILLQMKEIMDWLSRSKTIVVGTELNIPLISLDK
jgi:hypothetical protein